jgi:hypothetical protein
VRDESDVAALPGDAFAAIFDFYRAGAMHHVPQRVEVALPGARISKMASYHLCVAMTFLSAIVL